MTPINKNGMKDFAYNFSLVLMEPMPLYSLNIPKSKLFFNNNL